MFRSALLLLLAASVYSTLILLAQLAFTPAHNTQKQTQTQQQVARDGVVPAYLHLRVAGQCEYNVSSPHPIPSITAVTGTGTGTGTGGGQRNTLFIYDTTFTFEHGGDGEGMAYFVAALEAETPKYIHGGNHAAGAGAVIGAVQELFSADFRCRWHVPRIRVRDGSNSGNGNGSRTGNANATGTDSDITEETQADWYLNGDTSTFSLYCRIPASIGWVDLDVNDISLLLLNSKFVDGAAAGTSTAAALSIPICERSSAFHKIAVCTQPLHQTIKPQQLKQWLEYHYMLGVDHFYIYDRDIDGSFKNMLQPYERAGIATRYYTPFVTNGVHVHMCLHRHRYTSRWLFFLDANEYLHSDKWTQKRPHVAKFMSRYQEAGLHMYTHLIVWKRTAIPQQHGSGWNQTTTLALEHATKYSKPQRVGARFAVRPWDGPTLAIHKPKPNSAGHGMFNSQQQDVDPVDMLISHLQPHNTRQLNEQDIDEQAKPPHTWITQELRYRMFDPAYKPTPDSVTQDPQEIIYTSKARKLAQSRS